MDGIRWNNAGGAIRDLPSSIMLTPPSPQPLGTQPLPQDEFVKWYGRWEPLDPQTISAFMDGFERPWCIVGG